MDKTGKQLIGSLTKGLIIMETLMNCDRVGVTELGKILGVNKSSAYRLLSTLVDRGFVEREAATGKYKLGMTFARFKMKLFDGAELRDVAKPFLRRLTALTKEASSLSVLSNNQVIVIDKQSSEERISANLYVGMTEPLYCTALGKAILSNLPDEEQEKLLNSIPIVAYTPKTMLDIGQIKQEMKRTELKGVAIDDEEYSLGMRCLAAPIFNYKGEVIASMGISGPLTRVRTEKLDDFILIVKEVTMELSDQMGYHPTA